MGAFDAPVLEHLPPIITSKIEPPPLRPTTLTRHRQLDRLPLNEPKRVTLIVADPGFGKTTLLADFSSRYPGRCLWYRLDETDRDWITLVNYVIAALRELEPGFGRLTTTLLRPVTGASPSRKAVLGSLLHELQTFADQSIAIVLDDFQAADPSDDVAEVVGSLVRDAPPSFSFVISSRRRPAVPLARWAGLGELSELSTDDLRFSASETSRLFAEAYGQPLDPELLAELQLKTDGWAVSLQLFYSLIRGRSVSGIRSVIRSLSGATSPVYEFLAEEILGQMPERLLDFALRASILETIAAEYVVAALEPSASTFADAERLMEEAEREGIVTKASRGSSARQFHPLLREFLQQKLKEQLAVDEIASIHHRVAQAAQKQDLLAATHHYIEAGRPADAMRCLAESVVQTMGSGRWGAASRLIERLSVIPAHPAIVAIRARRLLDDGELREAASLLDDMDVTQLAPDVRAVLRHTRLALAWRTNDQDLFAATLQDIDGDRETPKLLRQVAQVMIDASPMSRARATLPSLTRRLRQMASDQLADGHDFYAAVSLHNAASTALNAGSFIDAVNLGYEALAAYDKLPFARSEAYSAHAILTTVLFELGRRDEALDHLRIATDADDADGDVHAECAYLSVVSGDRPQALLLLDRAEKLDRLGRLDLEGQFQASLARGFLLLPKQASAVIQMVGAIPQGTALDLGYRLLAAGLLGVCYLLTDCDEEALQTAAAGRALALAQGNARVQARLRLISAMADRKESALLAAVADAPQGGELALLETADALVPRLPLLSAIPEAINESIARWPKRWLPILRRQLDDGNTPAAHVAADLLDIYGEEEDIGRLIAFDRTYRRRARQRLRGKRLARRLSPILEINDLGRGKFRLADREIFANQARRKPISLLFYLVTRPNFTATREQVLDDLWPEADPEGGANSLNQSLHFLRRELDPWYEVGVSQDYVCFDSELLWLDSGLVTVASAEFLRAARVGATEQMRGAEVVSLLSKYRGQFCPEFEYDEWAIAWRTRVHAAFLDVAHRAMDRLIEAGDAISAREIAVRVLNIDPSAVDVERRLIWLYERLGSHAAAETHYRHLASGFRADGLEAPSFNELIGRAAIDRTVRHPTY